MAANPNDILHFWREAGSARWFAKSDAFDAALRLKFESVHHAAARGEYDAWAQTAEGALALLLLLDQVPRNLYRGSGHAYATDGKALNLARASVSAGFHHRVEPAALRQFFIVPFEHSEKLADQDEGLRLARELGDADLARWCERHRDIIARFGRFPHRNPALGRVTTLEELAFLDDGGFAG